MDVRRYLDSGAWRQDAVEVKRNRLRVVFRCVVPRLGLVAYVKEGVATDLVSRVKNLFRSKAGQEFSVLQQCHEAGVPAPEPLGWVGGRGGGILATREVPGRCLSASLASASLLPKELMTGLADFVGGLLRHNLYHPDMHPGNIIVSTDDGDLRLYLVDLCGVRLRSRLGMGARRCLVLWLIPMLEELPRLERIGLLARIGGSEADLGSWPDLVRAWSRMRSSKWKGWRRRLLGRSSLCHEEADQFGLWLLAGDSGRRETARAALSSYLSRIGSLEVLKEDCKRRVGRVCLADADCIVKEYRCAGRHWRLRPDRRAWLNTARIRSLTGRIASCHGWLRASRGGGLIAQEDVGRLCLHEHLVAFCPDAASRRPWRESLASALAYLHACGCFHADLKLANWVAGDTRRLRLVDCDDVRFYRHLPEWARLRNLRQIADSCPEVVSHGEKLRFLVLYARLAGLSRVCLRELLGHLLP